MVIQSRKKTGSIKLIAERKLPKVYVLNVIRKQNKKKLILIKGNILLMKHFFLLNHQFKCHHNGAPMV
jgi:hypothetical protein